MILLLITVIVLNTIIPLWEEVKNYFQAYDFRRVVRDEHFKKKTEALPYIADQTVYSYTANFS